MADEQDEHGVYKSGPLAGQLSTSVLLDAETTQRLQHASKQTGYSLERLVEISAAETALKYAKDNKLI